MVFRGFRFTFRGQGSGVCAVVCQIKKRYKRKEAVSLKMKGLLYSCLLTTHLPSVSIRCLIDICKPSIAEID